MVLAHKTVLIEQKMCAIYKKGGVIMKRRVVSLLMVGAMVFGLTACGGGGSDDGGSKSSGDVKLSVSIWDTNQEPGLSEILADFTEETGIEAEISVITWDEYWTMLEAGAQGGSLPDVFWMHSNESQRYMSNDMLLDLTDYIADSEEIDPENYPEDIWGLYTYDDKYYAVPKDVDTIALWYNKTLFDEANLDYPTADWTWDDLTEAAVKLTKDDGSQYGFAMRNDNNQAGYYNLIYGNNGTVISDDKTKSGWDSEETIKGMQQLEEWIELGVIPSAQTMSENNEDVLLESGTIAMTCQGSWMIAAFRDNEYTAENCDCVELPMNAETGRRVSIYNGLGWAASASTDYPEEAWKLIEYLGSKEGQEKQAELGITMSAYEGTSDAWAQSADFNLQAYLNMMEDMEIRPYSRTTVTWEDAASETLLKVYTGDLTMEEACKEIAANMNECLAEEQ